MFNLKANNQEIEVKFREKFYPTSHTSLSVQTKFGRNFKVTILDLEEMKMKINTLHAPITHERKPEFDEQRFNALDEAFAELCPMDEVAECMIDTLRMMNPNVHEVIADKHAVIIEVGVTIKEVNISGFDFADLYTTLIAEVLRQ